MHFRSDWLLDDPIVLISDPDKKLHTKDEIDNLSTGDNLSEVDKAICLLEKGQISQKLWVVRAINTYMDKKGSERVVAELIVIFT